MVPMSRAERGAISESLVLALGAVTTLVVLATTTVALVAATGDRSAAGESGGSGESTASASPTASPTPNVPVPTGPEPAFPDGQFVYGSRIANVVYQVPAKYDGWELETSGTVYYFETPKGEPVVRVNNVAAYNKGTCAENGNPTSQAYIGLAETVSQKVATLEEVQTEMTRRWREASHKEDDRTLPVTEPRTRNVTTASGQRAKRTTFVVTTATEPCSPPKVVYTLQTVDTGDSFACVALVRDAGTYGTLQPDDAQAILDSIDAEIPPA